ncbi:MAG: hypothetical protein JWO80_1779 [Bryobacterales bacterium]|nr:hypothetical protein [Bryobacterales bacterium]
MEVLALADDMTGALEVGAQFSARGLCAVVSAQPVSDATGPVVVLDTETRHLPPSEAARKLTRFVKQSSSGTPSLIYKKTDSTLRGNIRSELLALTRLYPHWTVGYAPAHPVLGRTVRNGCLFVHGLAVCETEFARDLLNPVLTGSVTELLGPEFNAIVFDGENCFDIEAAARTILADAAMRIAAGPAALAEQLALLIDSPRSSPPTLPPIDTCLVTNGSRHSASKAQIERALDEHALSEDPDAAWCLVASPHPHGLEPAAVARENASETIRRLARTGSDAVFLIGGDTAFAFIEALALPHLFPIREIVAGVPVSRIPAERLQDVLPGRTRDLLLITKAGGFGCPDLFTTLRERLNSHEH